MTGRAYPHLKLTAWPFNRAGPEVAEIWIGRPAIEKKMKMLLRSASRVSASQLYLMWADLGAGKTHALRHMQHLANNDLNLLDLVTIILTTPRGITSFFDVYRAAIDGAIEVGALASAGRDLMKHKVGGAPIGDVERAIIAIGTYQPESARIAQAWLRGDRVQRQASTHVQVTSQIRSAAEAIDALGDLIGVLRRKDRAVLLLVDEVQELADLAPKKRDEAVGGLHKVFDRNPEGLTMVLSFTAAQQRTMLETIGGPLADRANDTLTLPAISVEDATELVTGLLRHFAEKPDGAPFPFTPDAVKQVVDKVQAVSTELSPRAVILAFDSILREADIDIEDGAISTIDAKYALGHLP